MEHFFLKLISPRSTFPADMTESEGAIMQEHFSYWAELITKRKVVAYGPVMDPKGAYGVAVLEVENKAEAENTVKNDPAIKAKIGFRAEIHDMPGAVVRQ